MITKHKKQITSRRLPMRNLPKLDMSDVVPIVRETMQARVYRDLRQLLMVGRFRPGQVLKIRDLATAFGTSMQPVRESIRQLVAERGLEAAANSSARVPVLDRAQLEDMRLVRLAVEGLAAELAGAKATLADVKALTAIVGEEAAADDKRLIEASVSRNLEFHFRLYKLSDSAELLSIIEGLWLRIGPVIREAAEGFDAREGRGATHHVGTLKAMRVNDAARVRKTVEQDIDRVFDLVIRAQSKSAGTVHGKVAKSASRPMQKKAPTLDVAPAPQAIARPVARRRTL